MMQLIMIAVGGAMGALTRYKVSEFFMRASVGAFPLGTLWVNMLGSFLIGVLFASLQNTDISTSAKMFIFMGFLGAFTTFSTYSLETIHLMQSGAWGMAVANVLLNNVLSIGFAGIGFVVVRGLLGYLSL